MSDEQIPVVQATPVVRKKRKSKKRRKRSDAGVKRGTPSLAAVEKSQAPGKPVHREPFGGFQDKLAVYNKDPAYFYFWHAERGDDIERALAAGYRFVSRREAGRELPEALRTGDDMDRVEGPMRIHGGAGEYGRAYKLVLMRIPKELHDADMALRAKKADMVDDAIRRQADDEARYGGDISGIHTKVGIDADQ